MVDILQVKRSFQTPSIAGVSTSHFSSRKFEQDCTWECRAEPWGKHSEFNLMLRWVV